jgi:protein SERAC1
MEILYSGQKPVAADIIFVHGLKGHLHTTWTMDGVFWPKDLLPGDLPHARIMSWGYDADVASLTVKASQNSLSGFAGNLLSDISGERVTEDEV